MKPALTYNTENVIDSLLEHHSLVDDVLGLTIAEFNLHVRSNSQILLDNLKSYFPDNITSSTATGIEIIAIERDAVALNLDFIDWPREAGKTGRKDSYIDMADSRVLRKVRTGMVFMQSNTLRIAAGPCLANENQLVNFINSQYMTWLQHNDWLICHAAGLVFNHKAYAFAGFSGGGKSTLMLHLLNYTNADYLTNDRLFVRADEDGVKAAGIPKLPRINPGTIVHNPRLHGLITKQQREAFLAMPQQELWRLENKYDVFIDEVYGANRIVSAAPLRAMIILNWQHSSKANLTVERVQLSVRHDLLDAVMKSAGPFYQHPDGHFDHDARLFPKQAYLDILENIDIYEVKGSVDFDELSRYCQNEIFGLSDGT